MKAGLLACPKCGGTEFYNGMVQFLGCEIEGKLYRIFDRSSYKKTICVRCAKEVDDFELTEKTIELTQDEVKALEVWRSKKINRG